MNAPFESLDAQIAYFEAQVKALREQKKEGDNTRKLDAVAAVKATMAQFPDVKFNAVMLGLISPRGSGVKKPPRMEYAHTEDPARKWNGRGPRPEWIDQTPAELLIVTPAPRKAVAV